MMTSTYPNALCFKLQGTGNHLHSLVLPEELRRAGVGGCRPPGETYLLPYDWRLTQDGTGSDFTICNICQLRCYWNLLFFFLNSTPKMKEQKSEPDQLEYELWTLGDQVFTAHSVASALPLSLAAFALRFVLFSRARYWTQGLTNARKALFPWAPSPEVVFTSQVSVCVHLNQPLLLGNKKKISVTKNYRIKLFVSQFCTKMGGKKEFHSWKETLEISPMPGGGGACL